MSESLAKKRIEQQKLSEFLLTMSLTKQLDYFVIPLNGKKVDAYGVEKFHLMGSKHYQSYLPNTDVSDYPNF